MQQLLDHLRVPPEYPQYSEVQSDELVAHLNKWKQDTHSQLSALASLVEDSELSLDEQSSLVFSVAQYAGDGPWVLSPARISAESTFLSNQISSIHKTNHYRDPIYKSDPNNPTPPKSPCYEGQACLPGEPSSELEPRHWAQTRTGSTISGPIHVSAMERELSWDRKRCSMGCEAT